MAREKEKKTVNEDKLKSVQARINLWPLCTKSSVLQNIVHCVRNYVLNHINAFVQITGVSSM